MRKLLVSISILMLFSCEKQFVPDGKYGNDDSFLYLIFSDYNNFKLYSPSGPQCGILGYDKGTFKIKSDTLYLKLDFNYPSYQEDYNKQGFSFTPNGISVNDSIQLTFNILDPSDQYPLPETKINSNGRQFLTDYDGNVTIQVPKNEKQRITAQIFDTPIIDTTYVFTENTNVQVSLNSNLKDLSKEYFIKYKILEMSKEKLVLKGNKIAVLHKMQD